MTTMTVDELEQHLREVLERVKNGERVLIASEGKTVAELGPHDWKERVEKRFPGVQWATKSMRDVHIEPLLLEHPVDAVELVRQIREDRDPLP